MSSCCRAQQKDPNLEFFDAVDKLTFAIASRSEEDLKDDASSSVRWSKYQALKKQLDKLEEITGKKL